jgi:hypothetical protein
MRLRMLTGAVLAVSLVSAVPPISAAAVPAARAGNTLTVRWTAGDPHGRATVYSDLRGIKVCDWANDRYTVAIKWGIRVWLAGWRDDWKSMRAPQGGCESYTWDPGGRLHSRVMWASYCASPGPGKPTRCGTPTAFPDGAK